MMARWLCTLVNLLIFNLLTKYATASLTPYGKRFLIALPKVDVSQKEQVHFLLGTMANKIQVMIMTNHYYGDQLETSVTVRRSRVERYVLGDAFVPKTEGGMESFTYEFKGEASFSLAVLMNQQDQTASSFLALPLNVWGKNYYYASSGNNPTFHFVTLETTELTIKLDGMHTENAFPIVINGKNHSLGSQIKYKLDRQRSFMISLCSFQNEKGFMLFEIKVQSSERIGLIAGNCKAGIQSRFCGDTLKAEGALEMAFSGALNGTEFIYWSHLNIEKQLFIIGVTPLTVTVGGMSQNIGYQALNQIAIRKSGLLTVPKPVGVYMRIRIICYENIADQEGDFSYVQLVPNDLFDVFYLWRAPIVNVMNLLTLVVETEFINTIRLDDNRLHEKVEWIVAEGQTKYSVAIFETQSGSHTVRSNVNRKFGCYISGVNKYIGHAHPAGFSDCVHKDNETGGRDVCTGGTDEESFTYGLRESDQHHIGVGFWSEWKGWTCTKKGVKIRTRSCEKRKACIGMHDDISNEPCKPSAAQKIFNRGNVVLIIIFTVVMMVNY